MFSQLFEKFTNGFTEVPLFRAVVSEEGVFETKLHPTLNGDEFIEKELNGLIDHVQPFFEKLTPKMTFFYVTFNLKKYKESGEKGSCDLRIHPNLKGDEMMIEKLNQLVDHIRANYDMEKLSK